MKTSNILIGGAILAAAYLYTKKKDDTAPVAIPIDFPIFNVGPITSGNTGVVGPDITSAIIPLSTPIKTPGLSVVSASTSSAPVESVFQPAAVGKIIVVDRKNAHLVQRVSGYRMPMYRTTKPALKGGALI